MSERWREPLRVLDFEPGDEVFVTSDGRIQRTTKVIYDRDSTERIRLGYACARCMDVFPRPWPEACPSCGAPIRARQAEYFAREYAGVEHLGPRTTLEEELEGLPERAAAEEAKRRAT